MVTVKRHMSGLSDSEYLDLLKKLVKEQYDEPVEDFEKQYFNPTPSFKKASKIKEKLSNIHKLHDFSESVRDEIEANISTTGDAKVGPFSVKYMVSKNLFSMYIMEDKIKNFAGKKGTITERVNMFKDNRFNNKDWLKYFSNRSGTVSGHGRDIPKETFIDIIKFLQFVCQNPAFL